MRLRGLLGGMFCLSLCASAWASDWVEFANESGSRLPAALLTDTEEKDYAWGDVDQDGDIDLVVVRKEPFTTPGKRANLLLMNEGGVLVNRTGEFATASDVPGDLGFQRATNDRDVQLVDLDGDGWLDIITATTISDGDPKHVGHPRVYINLQEDDQGNWLGFEHQDARIPQMLSASGNVANPRFCSVAVGDVTGDGAPDLYFGDYDSSGAGGFGQPPGADFNNKLLINDGNGFFTDESVLRMGLNHFYTGGPGNQNYLFSQFGAASVIADINKDGVNDVVKQTSLASPRTVAVVYNDPENEGFFIEYDEFNTDDPYFVSVGDLNNDTWLDMVVVDDFNDDYHLSLGDPSPDLEVNFQQFTFGNSTNGFGGNSWIADLNNDGWNDVFITDVDVDIAGCQRTFGMYRNNADGPSVTFTRDNANIPDSGGGNMLNGIHDVAIFDIDGDGWLDMVIGRCSGTQLWMNVPPLASINFQVEQSPVLVEPGEASTVELVVEAVNGVLDASSVTLHVSVNGGPFTPTQMSSIGGGVFEGDLSGEACGDVLAWYVSAELEGNDDPFTLPDNAPADAFTASVVNVELLLRDEIEGDVSEWTVMSVDLLSGEWEQANPNGTILGGNVAAPDDDATPDGVMAFVTENGVPGGSVGAADVDGGPTFLISPAFDLEGMDGRISYFRWFFADEVDFLTTEISNDGGNSWVLVDQTSGTGSAWQEHGFFVSDFIEPTGQMHLRFSTDDDTEQPGAGIVEAGIDDLQIDRIGCDDDTPVSIVSSVPADGSIDARQPFDINGDNADGWSSIELTFDGDVSGLVAGDFEITQNGGDQPAPTVAAVNVVSGDTVEVVFSGIIDDIAWTTIRHIDSDTSVSIASLPGDVNGDGTSAAGDVLTLIDAINGQLSLPDHSTDIDRSGASGGADVLREIDLLNGANAYDEYLGAQLPQ